MTDIVSLFNTIFPYALSYIAGHGGGLLIQKLRSKMHGFRELVDIMDNAMTNDQVSEADAQATWRIVRNRLSSA